MRISQKNGLVIAVKSMTGYGRAEYKESGLEITVELKTVNNRYLDVNAKYPRGYIALDDMIRSAVKDKISRGRIDLFINVNDMRDKDRNVCVDMPLAKSYIAAAETIYGATDGKFGNITLTDVMRFPDVVKTDDVADEDSDTESILKNLIYDACDNLNIMREKEGEKLKTDMLSRLEKIENTVKAIKERAPLVAENYREKLRARMTEYLKDVKLDEARLYNEVAVFSDKSNIDEELTRLNSHIVQFREICKEDVAGKKLDFLVQEFNREANTICSKSNDLAVTNSGLDLKCEIEKIREQVQNIE